jgi:hypothetical protein
MEESMFRSLTELSYAVTRAGILVSFRQYL